MKSKILPIFAGLSLCLSAVMPLTAMADYCQSGAMTRTETSNTPLRKLISLTVSDGTTSTVVSVNQSGKTGTPTYFDKTSSIICTQAGETLSFTDINWPYSWMHAYAYVDYDNDGTFNTTLNANGTNSGEVVSYTYYNSNTNASTGTNSKGQSSENNSGIFVDNMPSFTLPANLAPGDYRLRFKIDWNSLNPCGATVEKDGGAIVDMTIRIEAPRERTVSVSSSDPEMGSVAIAGTDALSLSVVGPVQISATPLDGYEFVKWTNDATAETFSTQPTVTVGGNSDIALTAQFMEEGYDPSVVNLPKKGANGARIIPLSSLEIEKITIGWGTIKANKSIDNNPLKLKGITYTSGVGAHASAKLNVKLNGAVTKFHCVIGIDDEVISGCAGNSTYGNCDYSVRLVGNDGSETVVSSGSVRNNQDPAVIDIDNLQNYKYLVIEAPDGVGGDSYDHVDFANAYFEYIEQNSTPPAIVTDTEMEGLLRCATVTFSQPGVKYMHKLRASSPTAEISVSDLPDGLVWNEARNLVEGTIDIEGEYTYTVLVRQDGETSDATVHLTVSSNLQQPVPFMGWLSWNVVESEISEEVIRNVADAMVSKGIADAGYNYLVIDDLWHASARQSGTNKPLPDAAKFPNGMKVCSDYVHDKGLKFGIYSDAANKTCANAFGSYGYETIDANQYAEWGVDLLKYDYCHAPSDVATAKERYKAMGDALKASGRNILFYMCEWGVREPWKWGAETGATCWRATYDTRDGWNGKDGGIGIVESVAGMKDIWPYHGVNRFNDADMMCVGIHGTGKSSNDLVVKAGMTMTEYQTQFAMWCMWGSPLTLSFDLRKEITAEDLAMITNPELIAINQDRMGQAAEFVYQDGNQCQLYFKDLENGDVAVAVLNLSSSTRSFTIDFNDIAPLDDQAVYNVRDLINRQDLEAAIGSIQLSGIQPHETRAFRLSREELAGLGSVAADSETAEMTVADLSAALRVSLPGTEGLSKRILVSDVEGRVLASATTTADSVDLNRPRGPQTVVVSLTCAGKTHISKTYLR